MPRSTRPLTRMLLVLPLALLAACGPGAPVAAEPAEPGAEPMDHLDYTMNRIDGAEEPLDTYRGKVVLVVNVASKCGLTPQYKGLEALYLEKQEDGLVILGFPANNFMGQEPGTNEEIAAFCEENYGVTFPMFEKISVKGDDAHPLYQLASQPRPGSEPSWNFTKYLLDREGRLVERYGPRTAPDDETLRARIDELLATG
jgi:glutathione peroxidase